MNFLNHLISSFKSPLAGQTGSLQDTAPAEQNPVLGPQVSHENPEHSAEATALAAPEPSAAVAVAPAPTTASTPAPTATTASTPTLSPEEEAVNRIQSQVDFDMTKFLKLLATQFPEAVEGLVKQALAPLLNSSVQAASETTLAPNQTAPTSTANTTPPILAA